MAPVATHESSWASTASGKARALLGLAVSVANFRRSAHEADEDSDERSSGSSSKTDVGKIIAIVCVVVAIICAGLVIWGAQWYLGRRKVDKLVNKWSARRDVLTQELDDNASSTVGHSRSSTAHGHRVPEETREGPRVPLLTNPSQRVSQAPVPTRAHGTHEIILASTPMQPQKKRSSRPASAHSINSLPGSASSSINERQGVRLSSQVVLSYESPRGMLETDLMRSPIEMSSPVSLHSYSYTGRAAG